MAKRNDLEKIDLNKDELKQQLMNKTDIIINIISKGNTAEIRKNNKDGMVIYEVVKKKQE